MKCLSQLMLAALCASLIFSACKKVQEAPKSLLTCNSTNPDALVATPGGLIRRSHIHLIESGYALMRRGGHMYKVERASRNIIEDFGKIHPNTSTTTLTTIAGRTVKTASVHSGLASMDQDNSWVTDAHALNPTSTPISSFSANWVVPNNPASNDNQLLYIFDGLENAVSGTDIMQPVLQWGSGPAGNTNGSWAVANWYVWTNPELEGLSAAITPLVAVSPNTLLEGTLTYAGQEGASAGSYEGSYNYTSSFTNLTTGQPFNNPLTIIGDDPAGSNNVIIPFVPQQTAAYVTLEAWTTSAASGFLPGVTQASDYPAGQNYLDIYNILFNVGGARASVAWTAENLNTPFGESTTTTPKINFSQTGGSAVYIYWHPIPTINNISEVPLTTTSTSYTINAYPGTLVNVEVTGNALLPGRPPHESGTTTSTLTITTPGVTFTGGSTSVSATNGTNYFTVTMPSGGSLTVNGSYTTTAFGRALILVGASVF